MQVSDALKNKHVRAAVDVSWKFEKLILKRIIYIVYCHYFRAALPIKAAHSVKQSNVKTKETLKGN